MEKNKKNRRNFLKNTLSHAVISAASLSSLSLLSSCSSFDDFLFEDRYSFKDEVMVIGGGISGLYLAYKLRNNKTEFRLFEGSNSFGGRIKSNAGGDYGASLISTNDKLAKHLLQELSLETRSLDKDFIYLTDGMQALPDILVERIIGLIPYRNFRLRWKLTEIQKNSTGFEVVFENPTGQKRFSCKKIALAIPPSQWSSVTGLLKLPEMNWASEWLNTLNIENTIKFVLPYNSAPNIVKPITEVSHEDLIIRQIFKKNKSGSTIEIDVNYLSKLDIPIDYIYEAVRKKLQLNYSLQSLSTDQYYDWQQVRLINGSKFRNHKTVPEPTNYNFHIVGDFTSARGVYSIEEALLSANRASELLF